ncbi:HEAT repeat domain-containing protein [Kitasatospora sp. NPDC086801]|uniref:HEAT repeat domain-containing protein n=1 Tax=Kitasatospora sp. NPDC086801 TaxID=3364066 RepID=UPI0038013747
MDLAHALDGLDAHPWASVSHAYGPADDLPGLLRALTAGGEQADEALAELYSCILHQGSVYTASADAVPYLARIAAAGCEVAEVLGLIGGLAESEGGCAGESAPVRAAVVDQLPLLLPLLADGSAAVRQAAAWAVGQTRAVDPALPALRHRWASETDPVVRGELLTALGRLDRSGAATEAGPLLGEDTPAPLRLAAVLAGLDAGEPWTGAHHAAVLALLPTDPIAADRYDLDRREPLRAITEDLLLRETPADRDAAYALLDRALRDERPEVRAEAVWAAEHACQLSRSAPRRLLPALAPLVADPAVVHLLGSLGPAAAETAPGLAALATQADDEDGDGADEGAADQALAALVLVAPRAAAPLLASALDRRPRALDAAAGMRAPADAPFPFDPELLAAVRARLTAEQLGGNEHHQLFRLLRQWGRAAAPALPELCAVLPRHPEAAAAVAAVAAGGPVAERDRAAAVLREVSGSVAAARALYDLTGDPEALLGALADRLAAGPYAVAEAARAAADLGPEALALAPALRAALSAAGVPDTSPVLDADLAVADALWRIAGDAAEVVPILDGVLRRADDGAWFDRTAVRAARVAALLGPPARSPPGSTDCSPTR